MNYSIPLERRKKIDAIHEEMLRSVPKVFQDREAVGRSINTLEG